MRGGLSGFLIFLTCIALGVAAIGGVNSVARVDSAGVANEGQSLLGGDLRFELVQREASAAEKAFFESLGTVAEDRLDALDGAAGRRLRPGAGRAEGRRCRLSAVRRAGDDARRAAPELLAERGGVFGAVAPDTLFERLGLSVGDQVKVGSATFQLRACSTRSPTRPPTASASRRGCWSRSTPCARPG